MKNGLMGSRLIRTRPLILSGTLQRVQQKQSQKYMRKNSTKKNKDIFHFHVSLSRQSSDSSWELLNFLFIFFAPFFRLTTEVFLGSVFVYLQSLAYKMEVDETLSITNYQGHEEGLLRVGVYPCDQQGRPLSDDALGSPSDLLDNRVDFLIKIPYARGVKWLSEDSTRGVLCKYKFYTGSLFVVRGNERRKMKERAMKGGRRRRRRKEGNRG